MGPGTTRRSTHTATAATLAALLLAALAPVACGDDGAGPGAGGAGGAGGALTTSSTSVQAVSTTSGPLPERFTVRGTVTDGERPVEGALVMQAGGRYPGGGNPVGPEPVVTGVDGSFELELDLTVVGEPTIVAAKVGWRSAGLSFDAVPAEPIVLRLYGIAQPDNALGYDYGHPGVGDPIADGSTEVCGHCHTSFVAEFRESAHARATKNPLVQDLYAGVASSATSAAACASLGGTWRTGTQPGSPGAPTARCYVGSGVLPDLNACGSQSGAACDDPALPTAAKPTKFGACADCHALGLEGPLGGRDLLDASGLAYELGNHCDACHKIADVDLSLPPGTAGRLRVQRPRETLGDTIGAPTRQVMFGPLPDVPLVFMGGSWQPKFATAELCAGCHQQEQPALLEGASLDESRWPEGLPIHSTFEEWSDSAWGTDSTPCQFCHMPPSPTALNSMDIATPDDASIAFGFARPPARNRSHSFRGPLDGPNRLLDGALTVGLAGSVTGARLDVAVTLINSGCGHALPTGEPMRALLLVVDTDACGERMRAIDGYTIGDVGGALARGVVGASVTLSSEELVFATAPSGITAGQRVRVLRPTGLYDDYEGVGYFGASERTPEEKGLEIFAPVDEAAVLGVTGATVLADRALMAQPGDVVVIAEALPASFVDGADARALAGAPGHAFARVLVDPEGRRQAPQHRAVDIASDNRIPPQGTALSSHAFAIPPSCTEAKVTATVLYRPRPLWLARERGWPAKDHVAAKLTHSFALR